MSSSEHASRRRRADSAGRRGVRVIAVASGKGGVGKTQIAVNLSVALAGSGRSTLLLDADLGLANVDVLLGLTPRASLEQVIDGEHSLDDVIIDGPAGLKIVPAATGKSRLANLSVQEQSGLIAAFSGLSMGLDFMIVDTATGVDQGVLGFCSAASEIVVVICDEPASLTDAYALVKLLNSERGVKRVQVLCNRVRNLTHGRVLYSRFLEVCDRFLNVSLCHFGSIPEDQGFSHCAQLQQALIERYPSCPAGAALKNLAERADKWKVPVSSTGRPQFFAERAMTVQADLASAEAC